MIALRLRRLVQALGMRHSTLSLLQINLATMFYGLVLPAGNVTGIIARFYRMSRQEQNYAGDRGRPGVRAPGRDADPLPGRHPVLAGRLAEPVAGPGPHARRARRAAAPARRAVRPAPLLPAARPTGALLARQAGVVARGAAAVAGRCHATRWPRCSALGILTHGIGVVAFSLVAGALSLDLSLATIAWTRSAAVLVAILPISVAGLGVREGAMVILLAPYGIGAADALTYSLLAFATTVLSVGLLGGLIEAIRVLRGQR